MIGMRIGLPGDEGAGRAVNVQAIDQPCGRLGYALAEPSVRCAEAVDGGRAPSQGVERRAGFVTPYRGEARRRVRLGPGVRGLAVGQQQHHDASPPVGRLRDQPSAPERLVIGMRRDHGQHAAFATERVDVDERGRGQGAARLIDGPRRHVGAPDDREASP